MGCEHKNKLSLYGRDKNKWISTKQMSRNIIYCCKDCGAILEEKLNDKKTLKFSVKEEIKDGN